MPTRIGPVFISCNPGEQPPRAGMDERKKRARAIERRLAKAYPDARCTLDFRSPLELLVATVLSAQCTDERVNLVTKDLFRKYRTPEDYALAPPGALEKDIRSTGFYRNKAKGLRSCCRQLIEQFDGKVPDSIDALVALPGIGRKTANVIMGNAFGKTTGITVDTHVRRLANRLGLTRQADPGKIERDLVELVPQSKWVSFGHRMIQHGRRVCKARRPDCRHCPLDDVCPRVGVEGK